MSDKDYSRPKYSTKKRRVLVFFCAFLVSILLFSWFLLPQFAASGIEKSLEASFGGCQADLKSKDGFIATVGGNVQNAELNLKFVGDAPVTQITAVYADRPQLWTMLKAGEASLSENSPDTLFYKWNDAALSAFLQQRQSFMGEPMAVIGSQNIIISCFLSVYGKNVTAELIVTPQIEGDKLQFILQKVSARTIDGQAEELSASVAAKLAQKLQFELVFPPLGWLAEGAAAYLDNGFLIVTK